MSILISGCATNPVVNGKNFGGVAGASGGAYGGSVLCRGCSGGAKIAAIGGGALLGWLVGSKVGEYFDEKDKTRRIRLIETTLENNRDNETSTDTYSKSWRNPNTGQTEQATVQQSVTPLRTYRQNNNLYARNDIEPLPNQGIVNRQVYPYTNLPSSFCRDIEVNFSISINGAPPAQQQFYRMCRTQQGWRSIQ